MKFTKWHLNIGTEDKPEGLCGHKGKYMSYSDEKTFTHGLAYDDKCQFCMNLLGQWQVEQYWKGSITGQAFRKQVKSMPYSIDETSNV